jgi:GNAT superfamily N-acetyltransferase
MKMEVPNREWQRSEYIISTDSTRLDIPTIHDFISNQSYWGQGRAVEVVQRALDNSLNFGLYHGKQQVGFARVVTDYATFAWVADVFVLTEHRGRGLSKWLIEIMLAHPQLQGFRRWVWRLRTRNRYMRDLVLFRCTGLNAGWSARIRICKRVRTTGMRRKASC